MHVFQGPRRKLATTGPAPGTDRLNAPASGAPLSLHGSGYFRWANERVACLPMIETIEAVENIDEILQVPGVDGTYVGPADLSLTLGLAPQMDHADQRFQDALAAVLDACRRHGVVAGIQASAALAGTRATQGFRMITVGYDQAPVVAALRADLAASRAAVPVSPP